MGKLSSDVFREWGLYILLVLLIISRIYLHCNDSLDLCQRKSYGINRLDRLEPKILLTIREKASNIVRLHFPSPHSELLLGMLLGVDDLKKIPKFNNGLKKTGTIHVVVVSGFNINLVLSFVASLVGSPYKLRNLVFSQGVTLIYILLVGLDPPVIRAWIMSTAVLLSKYHGRKAAGLKILMFSAFLMLVINPYYLFSISFQLSFSASAGLVLYSDILGHFVRKITDSKYSFLLRDFTSTLAAQVLVWPIISFYFERVSIISLLVNGLVLWVVPIVTVLGAVFLCINFVSSLLADIMASVIMVPLTFFVYSVEFFSDFSIASVEYKPSLEFLISYYIFVLGIPVVLSNLSRNNT